MADDDWISIREGAELTGYTRDYVRDLAARGNLKAKKVVTVWLVSRKALLEHKRKAEQMGEKRGPKTGG